MGKFCFRFIALFTSFVFLFSCDKADDNPLYFTGSSLVEKWDVRKYFPTRITYNKGLSGSGLFYIESQGLIFEGEEVVIISGGNDVGGITDLQVYADHYVEVLQKMEAKRVYLFAILPRLAFEQDGYAKVRKLNSMIAQRIASLPEVTYIDLFDKLIEDGQLDEQYFYDGTHLNSWGYDLISDVLKDRM